MGGEVDAGGEFDALEELSAMSVVSVRGLELPATGEAAEVSAAAGR